MSTTRRPSLRPASLLVLALVIAACTGAAAPAGSSGPSGSPGFTDAAPSPIADLTFDAAIDVLAAGGIAVYREPGDIEPIELPAEPVSPATLLAFQVEQLVREANAGGGVSAAEIDELLPMPEDTVPFSMILAGYVATAQTPGARLAAERMADQDLEATATMWFPTIAIVTFVGETVGAIHAAEEAAGTGLAPAGSKAAVAVVDDLDLRLVAADPCGDFSTFLAGTIQTIKDAILSVIPSIPFLKAAVEWALTYGVGKVADVAKELLGHIPFLTAIADGVKVLALAATVVTTLRDVPVPVVSSPDRAHYSVGSTVNSVTLTATLEAGPGDLISKPVRNCADLLGIDLPKGGAEGSKVDWRFLDGAYHTAPGITFDSVVGASHQARYTFTTRDEPVQDHAEGTLVNAAIRVQVTVTRQDIEQVNKMITGLITDTIPSVVWEALVDRFGDPIEKLTAWTHPRSVGLTVVSFHVKRESSPPPSAPPSDEPQPSGSPPGSPPNQGDEFCRRYRALIAWGENPTEEELSQAWARYIDAAAQDMRRVAPPEMVPHVNVMIETYATYGYADEPYNLPLSGPPAARLGDAVVAIHRYCGIPLE